VVLVDMMYCPNVLVTAASDVSHAPIEQMSVIKHYAEKLSSLNAAY